jgi:HK97 family phage major capsid protein
MTKLKGLIEQKTTLQKELRALSDNITKENRAMTDDEASKFEELRSQIDGLNKTVDALQEARELADGADGVVTEDEGDKPKETPEEVEARERRAFAGYIRNMAMGREARADANLTFSDSSNAVVPKTIAQKIVETIYDISPVVDKATKYVTKGTLEIPVYGANSGTDITVAYGTEFTALESKIGKFTSVELTGYLTGALVKISNSLINNSDIDVVNFVISRIATEYAKFLEKELLIGTSGKVTGVALGATNIVDTATTATLTSDDLITLKNAVKQAYRKNAFFVASQTIITLVEKMKDDNGQYLFNGRAENGFNGTMFGYPVYASENMPTVLTALTKMIYFGDFSGLALKWSETLEVNVLRELYANQHATAIQAWGEFDGNVENQQKIAVLRSKAGS